MFGVNTEGCLQNRVGLEFSFEDSPESKLCRIVKYEYGPFKSINSTGNDDNGKALVLFALKI
jgi:hypothetical protein